MTALNKQAIDFSQPLETESGEPVKYICHDVIEYKCARVCVDIATGIVYSSPYVGLKIRNKEANPRAKLREQIESAADAYWQFDNGWISDMKCGDLSHEYLLFVKEPKNVLALLDDLEAAENNLIDSECHVAELEESLRDKQALLEAAEKRIAEQREYYEGVIADGSRRIAELEARKAKPVMFIDGDISPADADKLAAVIRKFNEETETPAARMARIIRENPRPTNMCDMPAAGISVKGE